MEYINNLDEQEAIDYMLYLFDLENEHSKTIPRASEVGWFHVFPEALKKWGPVVKRRLKDRLTALGIREKWLIQDTETKLRKNTEEYRDDIIKEGARRNLQEIARQKRIVSGMLQHLHSMQTGKKNDNEITPDMIERAKSYPIDQLVEVNRSGFAKCIWHNDSKPSMYCKKNFAHCFTCGESGDTIRIVREKEGLSFPDAIRRLQ